MMNTYRIASIPGDGIGLETLPESLRVLEALGDMTGAYTLDVVSFPWGSAYYLEHLEVMPPHGLETLKMFDAIYFGAIGWPDVPDSITLRGLRLAICQGFEQYANLRPARLLPGIRGPLRDKTPAEIDFVVVRENTEGEYVGAGGYAHYGQQHEVATETSIFSRAGIERVMRYAFKLASSRPRRRLSAVTKSNAQPHGFGLWDRAFEAIAAEFPDVITDRVLVDAMAARMVLHPESLDVVVASNLHADILTDLAAAICGGLGVAPSGNINPERQYPSMFEPVHGSAPDIAGKGVANPIGTLLSGAMMLDFLGEHTCASQLYEAVAAVTAGQEILTPDLGGKARTIDVCEAVISALEGSSRASDAALRI